jgi:hypothetical protein
MGSAVLWLRRFLGLALLTTGSVTPIDCMPLLGGIGDYSLASRPRIIIRSGFVGGRSPHWIKVKNPNAPAVKREAEEDWYRKRPSKKRTPPQWE